MLSGRLAYILALISLLLSGCVKSYEHGGASALPLQAIFEEAPFFDRKKICTSGIAITGEGFAVYPSMEYIMNHRFDRAAILIFEESISTLDNEVINSMEVVSFCGRVEILKECWKNEDSGVLCVPYTRPIHIRVDSYHIQSPAQGA